ncbi:hypothetical protein GBAR_LOCUS28798 [Geodia barretti]|uniref:Uncharacterized protein n=1 Tax=Geodia barretti TaxID=519541 RepID=A0AA35TRY9_GEOBA|nr:hypothetical protein GBAR_LOCUS28798 [Geodia barretti]
MSESELGAVLMLFNKQIHGEGLERLRFILYPLLPWAELKMLSTPSDMYMKLVSLDMFSAHGRALNIFLFALKAIGGSVRGKYCAKEARRLLNYQSAIDFSGESRKFRFFYWLLKIVRRLPPACKEDILLHFGRSLNTNYRNYEGSLPSLFIELHQAGKVSEDDTSELGDTLKICKNRFDEGTPEFTAVQKCISYLTKFSEEEEPFTSADEESTAASMHESHHEDKPSDVIGRKHPKKQRKKVRGRYPSGSSVPYGSLVACAPDNNIDTPDGDDIDDPAPKEMETSTDSVHYRMREGAVIPAALIYCVLMKSTKVQTLGKLRLLIDEQSY